MKKASTLQAGDLFKKPGQTYWREAKSVVSLPNDESVPHFKRGKLLVIVSARKKIIFSPNENLLFQQPTVNYKSLSNN